jgi:nitrogen fixation protein
MDFLSKLLEACLDTINDHPAWITDELGAIIASNLSSHSIDLDKIDINEPIIKVNNKKYKYFTKELNHGTNCYLHELKDQSEVYNELLKSIDDLEARLSRLKKTNTSV